MVWLIFLTSSAVLVAAAIKLAEYGDAIAARTKLGGMFIGTLLLAGATSLPELLTIINALRQGAPNLTAGDLFGSCMFNIFLLGVLDLLGRQERVLRRVAMRHALTAGLAMLLIGMAVFFMLADINVRIGWVGVDSLLMVAVYVGGIGLIERNRAAGIPDEPQTPLEGTPGLRHALIGFGAAALVLVLASPWLVRSAREIAEITGLGVGFVGVAMVGVITSLPELVTTVSALRLGAYDLAVGNLFGSNMFNMFALGLADVFFTGGSFLGVIAPEFALAGLLGLLLTGLGLIGNLARVERRLFFVEADALAIMAAYLAGLWLLYIRGIGI